MYEAVLTLHILSGMTWVGGLIVYSIAAPSLRREQGEPKAADIIERMDKATIWLAVTPFVVIGTGITQVLMSEPHDWSDLWVTLAIGLVILSFVVGGTNDYMWRKSLKEVDDEAIMPRAFDRLVRLLWLETAVLFAVVALMVFKPV